LTHIRGITSIKISGLPKNGTSLLLLWFRGLGSYDLFAMDRRAKIPECFDRTLSVRPWPTPPQPSGGTLAPVVGVDHKPANCIWGCESKRPQNPLRAVLLPRTTPGVRLMYIHACCILLQCNKVCFDFCQCPQSSSLGSKSQRAQVSVDQRRTMPPRWLPLSHWLLKENS